MGKQESKKQMVTVAEFLQRAAVEESIQQLHEALRARAALQGRPAGCIPVVSDMISEENGQEYQYVDYVQEGGGVLGVALVGYAYVLERLGIRFMKLAGTSAGAINTLMLAAVDTKNYSTDVKGNPVQYKLQTEAILHEMLSYDLWDLVDSNSPFGKRIISRFVGTRGYDKKLKSLVVLSLGSTIILLLLATLLSLFNLGEGWMRTTAWTIALVGTVFTAILAVLLFFLKSKLMLFVKGGFGINKCDAFHQWMTSIVKRNGVDTCEKLDAKMKERANAAKLRPERYDIRGSGYSQSVSGSMLKMITCDITNENKVEFPDFAYFYYDEPAKANPADFVRASMSIPIFYRPFTIECKTPTSRLEKMKLQGVSTTPRTLEKLQSVLKNITYDGKPARFVDGGILSNFPINVFHNPKIPIARLPTFGAKLEDEEHKTKDEVIKDKNSLGGYLGSIFTTLRFYYDRDFLKKNSVYQLGLGHIDVAGVNWLNFSMSTEEQIDLFQRGVKAATTFLLGGTFYRDGEAFEWPGYNWEQYKLERKRKMID